MLVIEEILSQAAQRLVAAGRRRPRAQLLSRGRHDALRPAGRATPSASATIWTQLKETSRFDEPSRRGRRVQRRASTHVKRGLAITPVKFGISFTATFFNQAGALVLVYRDGSVQVNHGGTEMGQGLFTKIQQIAADSLGVHARPRAADADAHRQGAEHVGTAASAGTDLNGAAVVDACAQLRGRLRPVAAGLLGVRAVGRSLRGRRRVAAAAGSVPFAAVCEAAYMQRVPLFAQGYYRTPGIHFDRGDRHAASRSTTSPTAPRCRRSKSTASPATTGCCAPTSCRTSATRSRRSSIAARSKAASSRASAG